MGLAIGYLASRGIWKEAGERSPHDPGVDPAEAAAFYQRSPLSPLLRPRYGSYPVEFLRSRSNDLLGLPGLGELRIISAEQWPLEDITFSVRMDDIPKRWKNCPVPISAVALQTSVGMVRALLIQPDDPATVNRICLFQHGHEGVEAFWEAFGDTVLRVRDRDQLVVLPIQPHMQWFGTDTRVSIRLLMLGRTLMGVRVAHVQCILRWLSARYPTAGVTLVGNSGGATVGYFASVVDEGIEAIAMDSFASVDSRDTMHCETVSDLQIFFREDGHLRIDAVKARSVHVQPYAYPQRDLLESWILSPEPGVSGTREL